MNYETLLELLEQYYSDMPTFLSKIPNKTSKNTRELIKRLVEEERLDEKEVAKIDYYTLAKFTATLRNMLLEYANRTWTKLSNPKELEKAEVNYYSKTDLYALQLLYFKKNNNDIYNDLVKYYAQNLDYNDITKVLKVFEMRLNDDNKEIITDIISHNLELLFSLGHSTSNFCIIMKHLESKGVDISRLWLDKKHPNHVEFKNIDPDYKWQLLKDLHEENRYDSFYYLRQLLHSKGISLSPIWKNENENDHKIILKSIREDEKWKAFDYLAKHNSGLARKIMNTYFEDRDKDKMITYSVKEIYDHYSKVDFNNLPIFLKNFVTRHAYLNASKEEKLGMWDTSYKMVVNLFDVNNKSLKSKEEYEKVLNEYLDSDLNITEFCEYKKISSIEGFKKMLAKFSVEEPYKELIAEKLKKIKGKGISFMKNMVKDLCDDEEKLKKNIINCNKWCLPDMMSIIESFLPDSDYKDILATNVVEYYYKRLNSYTIDDLSEENVRKFLTNNEIKFIVGNKKYEEMLKGEPVNISQELAKNIMFLNAKNKKYNLIQEKFFSETGIYELLKKYNTKAQMKDYTNGKRYLILENNKLIEVSEEIIEKAFEFAKNNHLYSSNGVINQLVKSIANNKISNIIVGKANEIDKETTNELLTQYAKLKNKSR